MGLRHLYQIYLESFVELFPHRKVFVFWVGKELQTLSNPDKRIEFKNF